MSEKNKMNDKQELNEQECQAKAKNTQNENGKKAGKTDKKVEQLEARIAELQENLAKSEQKTAEVKESWVRAAADFDNYKKRHALDRSTAYADGQCDVIKSILSIGDNLDRAAQTIPDEKTKEGIQLMIRQFNETLANLKVEEINPVGEKFDPNFHEAVHQVEPEDGDESGNVKSVFRKGYSLNGKILRYAQVVVIK